MILLLLLLQKKQKPNQILLRKREVPKKLKVKTTMNIVVKTHLVPI